MSTSCFNTYRPDSPQSQANWCTVSLRHIHGHEINAFVACGPTQKLYICSWRTSVGNTKFHIRPMRTRHSHWVLRTVVSRLQLLTIPSVTKSFWENWSPRMKVHCGSLVKICKGICNKYPWDPSESAIQPTLISNCHLDSLIAPIKFSIWDFRDPGAQYQSHKWLKTSGRTARQKSTREPLRTL